MTDVFLLFALAFWRPCGEKRILTRQTQFLLQASLDVSCCRFQPSSGQILTKVRLDLHPMSLAIGTPIGLLPSAGWILAARMLQTDRHTAMTTQEAEGGLTREKSHPID